VNAAEKPARHVKATPGQGRAFRGLVLVFVLSFVNLIGVHFTVTALGGVAG
jgi:hypothetical protein